MGQIETVTAINNPAFKTGMGKNGKPWTLMQVTTDKNNMTTVFGPVNIGDKLELEWDATYSSWKAQKFNPQKAEQLEAMRKLYELNLAIYKAVTGTDYGQSTPVAVAPEAVPTPPPAPGPDVVHDVSGDEEINLSDVPF